MILQLEAKIVESDLGPWVEVFLSDSFYAARIPIASIPLNPDNRKPKKQVAMEVVANRLKKLFEDN